MKRGRDQFNVLQADVAFASLDTADVAAVEAHSECEIFLAPPAIFSKLAHTIAEESFDVAVGHGDGIVVLDDNASTDLKSRTGTAVLVKSERSETMSVALPTLHAERDERAEMTKSFCEFFAGIGLVREGLSDSGWRCQYANDINPKKHDLYRLRFGRNDHFHLGDIWQTDEVVERIEGQPFLARVQNNISRRPCCSPTPCGSGDSTICLESSDPRGVGLHR